jgi:cob(I)alamin adenosyltransferase
LFGGSRVTKGAVRVEAMGSVDELNAAVGWAVTQLPQALMRDRVESIQHDLFTIGAQLAAPAGAGRQRSDSPALRRDRTAELERWIDEASAELPELRAFVLPGGNPQAAALHLARTVCRRAERAVVRLAESEDVGDLIVPYLNRLSDLFFTLARVENHRSGAGDVEWQKP